MNMVVRGNTEYRESMDICVWGGLSIRMLCFLLKIELVNAWPFKSKGEQDVLT